jgi:transcriptional regulator with XRE-family HTH domain
LEKFVINRDALYKQIGAKIRLFRQESGLNQAELAEQVKLNRSSIAQIETGKQAVSIHTLYCMAELLHKTIFHFLPQDDFDVYSTNRITEKNELKAIIKKYEGANV